MSQKHGRSEKSASYPLEMKNTERSRLTKPYNIINSKSLQEGHHIFVSNKTRVDINEISHKAAKLKHPTA